MKGLRAAMQPDSEQDNPNHRVIPYEDEPPIEFRREPLELHSAFKKAEVPNGQKEPLLPASMDAEKGFLSSILHKPDLLGELKHVKVESFFHPAHATVFKAMNQLRVDEKPIDLVTLTQELLNWNLLHHVGGAAALAEIQMFVPTATNAEYYTEILLNKSSLRSIIQLGADIQKKAQEAQWGSVEDLLAETSQALKQIAGAAKDRIPEVISVMDFKPAEASSTLLGNRWLCRGGAALIIGSSGTGKSSSSMQQDLLWSAGFEAFGIKPARPLKILTIQAENDGGDMYEMREGVMRGLELDEQSKGLIAKNLICCFEQARTGVDFVENVARPLLKKFKPDIIRIDPLAAYAGADITQASESAALLRNAINPLLTEHQCGLILVHHTPKTTSRDTTDWKPTDWMYSGAGSADIVNWARAVLVINPSFEAGKFEFMAAKRGGRIGWVNEQGEKEDRRWYQWAPGSFHWIPSDAAVKASSREKGGQYQGEYKPEDLIEALLDGRVSRKPIELQRFMKDQEGMSSATFWRLWKKAKESPFVLSADGGRFIHLNNLTK